jgi:hypothetical protein
MLTVLAGYDPADPDTAWNVGHVEEDYARYLDAGALQGARIGVVEHLFGSESVNQEVNDEGLSPRLRRPRNVVTGRVGQDRTYSEHSNLKVRHDRLSALAHRIPARFPG